VKNGTVKALVWKPVDGDKFVTHYREHLLRMWRTPSGWIVSRQVDGGTWTPFIGAPTRTEAERKTNEWAVAR